MWPRGQMAFCDMTLLHEFEEECRLRDYRRARSPVKNLLDEFASQQRGPFVVPLNFVSPRSSPLNRWEIRSSNIGKARSSNLVGPDSVGCAVNSFGVRS